MDTNFRNHGYKKFMLMISQLVKKFPACMEANSSLPVAQIVAIKSCPSS
jgi:hypothetical protein